MNVVLDTNVLVAGLLTPHGPSGRVIDLLLNGDLTPCFDDRVIAEYREVLARAKSGFDPTQVEAVLDYIEGEGLHVVATPLGVTLPDPDDSVFLEAAVAAGADWLITGNARHFPAESRQGIRVVDPRAFIERWPAKPE
jgi:putative PIN family toxin of toxin-antitoxin system